MNARALILAAGRGSRMQALTDEKPKCLVELKGKPLLQHQIDALRGAGIDEIGIVTGYRRELLAPWRLHEFHNPRWQQTNMVASLACAAEWLQSAPCIVSYSDIFYPADAVRALLDCDEDLALTFDPHWRRHWEARFENPLEDAETFRLDAERYLLEIGNRPRTMEEVQGQYMGLLRFTPAGWNRVRTTLDALGAGAVDRLHMTGTLQQLIERGIPVRAVACEGEWGEIDSASDLAVYQRD